MNRLFAVLLLAVSACSGRQADPSQVVAQTEIGAIPLTGRVVDRADVLTPAQESDLTARLEALENSTTDQVVVVTLPNLGRGTIEQMGLALGRGWGLGREDIDNGVLVIVAPNQRKVRIEVGYGLEGFLTDQRAAKTVQVMLAKFRKGDLSAGIMAGTDDVVTFLHSDVRRPRYLNEERKRLAA